MAQVDLGSFGFSSIQNSAALGQCAVYGARTRLVNASGQPFGFASRFSKAPSSRV